MADRKVKKQYGLIVRKDAPSHHAKLQSNSASAFAGESSEDETEAKAKLSVNQSILQENVKKKISKQTQLEIERAISQDPTVYEYDAVYDSMESKKKDVVVKKKEDNRKPKYINNLLKSAELRKQEQERRVERQVQKEREEEGDEFADKEAFVTESYRNKMMERQAEEEKLKAAERQEALNEVSKQKDLGQFYRHLLTNNVAMGSDERATEKRDPPNDSSPHSNKCATTRPAAHDSSDVSEQSEPSPPRRSHGYRNSNDVADRKTTPPSRRHESKTRHGHHRNDSRSSSEEKSRRSTRREYEGMKKRMRGSGDETSSRKHRTENRSRKDDGRSKKEHHSSRDKGRDGSQSRDDSREGERRREKTRDDRRVQDDGTDDGSASDEGYGRRPSRHPRRDESSEEDGRAAIDAAALSTQTKKRKTEHRGSNREKEADSPVNPATASPRPGKGTGAANGATEFYAMRTDAASAASAKERYLARKAHVRPSAAVASDSD